MMVLLSNSFLILSKMLSFTNNSESIFYI
jgi:hypothetical protein